MNRAGLVVAGAALLAAGGWARADMPAPPTLAERVALADAVVVGKVTGFGDKLVSAGRPFGPPGEKVDYQVAILQVSDALLGVKDAKEIKVGFVPTPPPDPKVKYPRRPRINLSLDQEAVLFLRPQADEGFYTVWAYYDVVGKKDDPNFDKELDEVKRYAKLLADPTAGLKSKSAADRATTASLLVVRYSTKKPGDAPKKEAIDADESKLILQGLADADWGAARAGGASADPLVAFLRLGLTADDGWKLPQDFNEIPDAAKKWLKDNADKYRVQRFVAEKKDK